MLAEVISCPLCLNANASDGEFTIAVVTACLCEDPICGISEDCFRSQSIATNLLIQRDITLEFACSPSHKGALTPALRVRRSIRRSRSGEMPEQKLFSRWNFVLTYGLKEKKDFQGFTTINTPCCFVHAPWNITEPLHAGASVTPQWF